MLIVGIYNIILNVTSWRIIYSSNAAGDICQMQYTIIRLLQCEEKKINITLTFLFKKSTSKSHLNIIRIK